jgi:hypothetical protein
MKRTSEKMAVLTEQMAMEAARRTTQAAHAKEQAKKA